MKRVIVNIQIALDICSNDNDLDQIKGILDASNEILQESKLSDYKPEIFTDSIYDSNISNFDC